MTLPQPLSGYRLMWMMVMFDLPTDSTANKRAYLRFRNHLLDLGFEMAQFSVYLRFCGERENTRPFIRAIRECAPGEGKISILLFTDQQFGEIINIQNRIHKPPPDKPEEFLLL